MTRSRRAALRPWATCALLAAAVTSACRSTESRATLPESERAATEALAKGAAKPASRATPDLLPQEAPPDGSDEFSTDFSRHVVPYDEILSGGPPKDGIPAIDEPQFTSVADAAEWLEPQEPVVVVVEGDEAKAYPVAILMYHEIVNDTVGDVAVAVTFCPLCNTAIVFDRRFDGAVLDFGTTGRLHRSNLIMYDRQTETWWQQATGEAIAGKHTGKKLAFRRGDLIAWREFRARHGERGKVLSTETGHLRPYGRNPYAGYDDVDRPPFLYRGPPTPGVLPPVARVLTVDHGGEAVAYPYRVLRERRAINDTVGNEPIVVFWRPGTASALDSSAVAGGRDVGAAVAFRRRIDDRRLTFDATRDGFVDRETKSSWDVFGKATNGPLAGKQLGAVVSVNHFWFSWAAFRPDTRVYSPGGKR